MATRALHPSSMIPLFLAPAFARPSLSSSQPTRNLIFRTRHAGCRAFSSTTQCRSKIGRAPLTLPPEVQLRTILHAPTRNAGRGGSGFSGSVPAAVTGTKGTDTMSMTSTTSTENKRSDLGTIPSAPSGEHEYKFPSTVDIEGPLGKMSLRLPAYLSLSPDETGRSQRLGVQDSGDKFQRAMWGTYRSYIQNHILGVSEGHTCILRMVGVGYRASLEKSATTKTPSYAGQEFIFLKLGYSHPIEMGVPQGIKVLIPQPTKIFLEGCDKEVVTQFAADIRKWRRPEPYKGKGIFVDGETIRLKGKKAK